MIRRAGLLALAVLVSGCALFARPEDTVRFNRGEFIVAYAEMKTATTILLLRIDEACQKKKLSQDACVSAKRIGDQLGGLEATIQGTLRNPETEFDWAAFMQAVELIAKLAAVAL